jgi:hypothetical protein
VATRYYLQASVTGAVSPTFSPAWTLTTSADRRTMLPAKVNNAIASKATTTTTAINDVLNRQFVGPPLQSGQTISGTVKGQLRGSESNADNDGVAAIRIFVADISGTVVQGTLLELTYPVLSGNEYTTSLVNRNTPISTSISSYTTQEGDRIVVEIGEHKYTGTVTARSVTQSFGDNSASDMSEDQTSTTANNPWVEFSTTLQHEKIERLQDTFEAAALDTGRWSQSTAGSGTITFGSGQISFNFPASSTASTNAQITSLDWFDLTGSSVAIEVPTVPSAATFADASLFLKADTNATSELHIQYEGGILYAQQIVAGAQTNPASVTYNATNHRWWRIRESGGTTYWETSPTGLPGSWTEITHAVNPIAVTNMRATLIGACFESETNPGAFTVGNFNTIGRAAGILAVKQAVNRASTY